MRRYIARSRIRASALAFTALGLGASFLGKTASARDPFPTRADRIASPGRVAASEDSAEALSLNPANIGYMPGAELRWTGVGCHDAPKRVGCGHSFELATPLVFGLGTGLRFDYVQTPWTAGFPYDGYDYSWLTWGLGYKASERFALGMSLQRSYSVNSYTNGLFGITASATFRPSTHLGFAVVAQDFNRPSTRALPPRALPVLDASYVFSTAFRPTGRRNIEVGLDLQYLQGADQMIPRAALGVDVPGIGRARADLAVAHLPNDERRVIVGSAGLEIGFGHVTAGGGVLFGNGLGSNSSLGEYGTISIAAYEGPGVKRPDRAVDIRIEDTPGPRGHLQLLEALWNLSEDKSIAAVVLTLRTEPADSYAHAEELADAIRLLRARGKKVLCSWEDNGPKSLYVCANADRTVVNPAGGLRYAGLRTQYIYLKGLLDKLGIKADIMRIGEHKSAPEQFTNERAGDVSRRDHEDMLRNYEAVFVKNVAKGRRLSPAHVRKVTKTGPFVAKEAREAGFVDAFAFDDELELAAEELVGRGLQYEEYKTPTLAPKAFGPVPRVGVLLVHGDMIDGRSRKIPIINKYLVGSYSMQEQIKALRDDPTIRSVLLRIESPGGSSMAADVMWRELVLLAKKKPLIVSMGSVAASGGYYIATAGKRVYALPLTVTGSIGIFYGKADVSGLLKKIGVNVEVYKTTERADAESFFRAFSDDERRALRVKIGQFYDVFLSRVAEGRHMTKAQVDAVGQGRVWMGQQAVTRGLVDQLGGFREALADARHAGGLPHDAPYIVVPPPDETLFEKALKLAGAGKASASPIEELPAQVKDMARAVAPLVVYRGDVPLARLEWETLSDTDTTE